MARLGQGERFHWLVAPSSTVIQASEVHTGVSDDPAAELDHLFERLVGSGRLRRTRVGSRAADATGTNRNRSLTPRHGADVVRGSVCATPETRQKATMLTADPIDTTPSPADSRSDRGWYDPDSIVFQAAADERTPRPTSR